MTIFEYAVDIPLQEVPISDMTLGLPAAAAGDVPEQKRYFFDVSIWKLIVMSTVTFGAYQIYWFYRNWRMAKERGDDVIPILRAIFAVLFAYTLFKDIRERGRSASLALLPSAGALALLFFLLQMIWRLPDPLWLLGFIAVLPLAIVQSDVAKLHRALGQDPTINDGFTWKNVMGIVLGGLWLTLSDFGTLHVRADRLSAVELRARTMGPRVRLNAGFLRS